MVGCNHTAGKATMVKLGTPGERLKCDLPVPCRPVWFNWFILVSLWHIVVQGEWVLLVQSASVNQQDYFMLSIKELLCVLQQPTASPKPIFTSNRELLNSADWFEPLLFHTRCPPSPRVHIRVGQVWESARKARPEHLQKWHNRLNKSNRKAGSAVGCTQEDAEQTYLCWT